jgi:hypothetical protein
MHRALPRLRGTALLLLASALLAPYAADAKPGKSTAHRAKWVSYDTAAQTVTVTIDSSGEGPNRKMLKKKERVTFRVVPTGSILKRTTVAINGQKAEISDIDEGRTVVVYWIPDPEHEGGYFARKIDVVLSQEEFDRRYEVTD